MNATKISILLFLISFLGYSQKEDAYFLLDNNHSEYLLSTSQGEIQYEGKYSNFGIIYLTNRKEHEAYQKKIKEAKNKFDSVSGRDNLNMNVFSLEFSVITRENIKLKNCELHKLNLVDYNWIKENSWKPINRKLYKIDFKNLYFLYKIKENEYMRYKVAITITVN